MWTAETVLVCALSLLGRSAASFPPIVFVEDPPPDVSLQAEAFVREGDPRIQLLTRSRVFQRLQRHRERCGKLEDVRKLASVLVHEEQHVAGKGEEVAYAAQALSLLAMGAGPGHGVYAEVARSRNAVLMAATKKGPDASRRPGP